MIGEDRYPAWEQAHRATRDELAMQRSWTFARRPLIGVVIDRAADPDAMARTVESVERQTYANWTIVGADEEVRGDCDFLAFVQAGDMLREDALFHAAKALDAHPDAALAYTDEDEIDLEGTHARPQFKPEFDLDYLYSRDFVGNLLVASRALLEDAFAGRRPNGPAWRYELALKAAESGRGAVHIPQVLYHRLVSPERTTQSEVTEAESLEAKRRTLERHLDRRGLDASVEPGAFPATLRTTFSPGAEPPFVSIVIPNMDCVSYLRPCLESVYQKAGYPNFEVIVVDNNSTEAATFEFYRHAEAQHANLRVVTFPAGPFNYSKVVNFGAACAKGELLLLLNNDTSAITDGFLRVLAGYFTRPEVGVVGPLLLFGDGSVQHAGLSLLRNGTLGFMNQGLDPECDRGYLDSLACPFGYAAVLGACQMVRASTFHEVGGYDEELAVTCNDLDFCWKVRRLGLSVVYTPHVRLFHKEFGSRGSDTATPARTLQGIAEFENIRDKWPRIYRQGDGAVNPNCDGASAYFALGS